MKKLVWKNILQTLAALAFLLVVWAVAYQKVGNELLVPSLSDSLEEGWRLLRLSAFWKGWAASLIRSFRAFWLSFAFAAVLAVLAYLYPALAAFLSPVVSALRSMPVLAVLLLLLSFLGAENAPVAVAFLSLFPILYTGIWSGLSSVDRGLIDVSRVQGTPVYRRVFAIYLPLSAPYILREAGAALSFALKVVVSAEVLANTTQSMGGMLQEARLYSVPQLFALVAVTFVTGLALEAIVSCLTHWAEKKIR